MRLVFWHNCLSPHQLPYVINLMDDKRVDEVIFAAPFAVLNERKAMGWSTTEDEVEKCGVKVVLNPSDDEICTILKARPEDSYHIFGGISGGGKFVFRSLQLSMLYPLHRAVVAERPNGYWFKWGFRIPKPGWMHRIKFLLKDYKYAQNIEKLFAMGTDALTYYKSLGQKWTVFTFAYCTDIKLKEVPPIVDDSLHFLFCGSLIPTKDPVRIIKAFAMLKADKCDVAFIGDGELRGYMEQYAKRDRLDGRLYFLGIKPQSEVPIYMQQRDVLILPSIYDGWGAVVNEALQCGCYVICSDACGSSDLIRKDKRLGLVFHRGNSKQLADCMLWCTDHLDEIRLGRGFRRQWSEDHISGSVIAKYLVDCLVKD